MATTTMRSRGIRAITVGEITGKLDLARSTFYLRFDSRSHLIEEVLRAYLDRLQSGAAQRVVSAPIGLERLIIVLEYWISDYVAQPGGCLILSGATECATHADDPVRQAVYRVATNWRSYLADQLRDAQVIRQIADTVDIEQLIFEIFSFALGVQHDFAFLGEPVTGLGESFLRILKRNDVAVCKDLALRIQI
ncbi:MULTISPECIES: TetR/AcrR family transcriptional regulator [unclassified Cupriavidus]|uniref:TetR/AcrR family transcriptional regulator n=1 Tax=unclassified Cupriavidus TaxID=2640874 RepID=UPI001C005F6F|nr:MULTISPECIES: TetR/AcrR family transcriptional regulator [unclassified Cupriavidus]MCA3183350.1 TetR/AcrR family transcriptional regulator [Cupriavidus sp.]MCA3194084.1 TetR/AcrR family transcriptional regulator [Cupriavidus sp.]MCA3200276.1 TetR/AcrR family transcriptional regulator [Cupriavidus sp.]MCA3236320.1 TetR/AcrR family transcriptional regulator [Cupriavidus sp.]QWE97591.1 TetR/AcrR family transcriptional regulator [Cupriavidus sp. EM10]